MSNAGDRALLLAHPEVLLLSAASLAQGRMRVATVERTIVGFVTTSVHDGHLELDALFVDPGWMRQGIAQGLVLDAVAIARALGLRCIEVTGNDHAREFYAQAGFVPFGVVDTPLGVPAARLRRTVPA
jgi:GNAT superfamily N-acetyltransferase